MTYKRKPDMAIENFIIEFQLKVNKVKSSGTELSDGVLGYALLSAANLPEDKHDMCKATCDKLTFKHVKQQLEKIGFGKTSKQQQFSSKQDPGTSSVKIEPCFYGDLPNYLHDDYSGHSSEDDLNGECVYYSTNRASFQNRNFLSKTHKKNPSDV